MATASALMSDGMAATIGKKELAAALNWSRPKLDRELLRNRNFPVVSRGDQSGGWQFDLEAVRAYLNGAPAPAPDTKKKAAAKTPPAIDKAQLRDAVAPPLPAPSPSPRRSAQHAGEASARQRKDEADAGLRELKLEVERGKYVLREEVRQVLISIFAGLGNDLDALPEEITKRCDLPESLAETIRALIDEARRTMAKRAESLLGDG